MKKPDFSKAKIGDEVCDIEYGWGKIIDILHKDVYPIVVKFSKHEAKTYTYKGKIFTDAAVPNLWWDEWEIDPPESALKPTEYIYIPNPSFFTKTKKDKPKYCCNCKYYSGNKCYRFAKRDLVTGNPIDNIFNAREMRFKTHALTDDKTGRRYSVSCGESAIYFEEKI